MFHIKQNKPVVLEPYVQDTLNKPLDPRELLEHTMVKPIMVPFAPQHPVKLLDGNQPINESDVVTRIVDCCQSVIDQAAEDDMKSLYHEALVSYPSNGKLGFKSAFVTQSGTAAKLPEPGPTVIYQPSVDVIPTCRKFLAGNATYDEMFATLAYYANPSTLGFYFANEQCFEDFKTFMAQNTANFLQVLPARTQGLCSQFQQTKLSGLTESLLLRQNDTDENDPFTFARFLIHQLMEYTKQVSPGEFGILPFDIGELIVPTSVVFVNIEQHARATSSKIANEWQIINSSLQNRTPMVSLNQLTKLTAMARNLQKLRGMAASALSNQMFHQAMKSAKVPFKKTPPTAFDITRWILKLMKKMETVNRSMNAYKTLKTTYQKPNRRDPDDFNKKGVAISTKYKPDIHIYLDTSGSISEENYQDAIKALIKMAKKMNVNLYFNSFSHVLSQGAKLHLEGKSTGAIYREFQKIPKVSGGTDYSNVWDYIQRNKQRRRELSILMTDFEYSAPNKHIDHPKHLYYAPVSGVNWNYLCRSAEDYIRSIEPNVPTIRRHILM